MNEDRGPEMRKLLRRLFETPGRTHVRLHVSWGPDAHLLTAEERARHLNEAFDAIDRRDWADITPPRTASGIPGCGRQFRAPSLA